MHRRLIFSVRGKLMLLWINHLVIIIGGSINIVSNVLSQLRRNWANFLNFKPKCRVWLLLRSNGLRPILKIRLRSLPRGFTIRVWRSMMPSLTIIGWDCQRLSLNLIRLRRGGTRRRIGLRLRIIRINNVLKVRIWVFR